MHIQRAFAYASPIYNIIVRGENEFFGDFFFFVFYIHYYFIPFVFMFRREPHSSADARHTYVYNTAFELHRGDRENGINIIRV